MGSMMTDLMAAFATQTAPQMDAISGVIRMADVVKADSLALELTLANGQQPIILLHPQAPVIKSYLAKCMSVSPVPDRPNSLTNAPRKASPTPVDKADSALVFSVLHKNLTGSAYSLGFLQFEYWLSATLRNR